MLDFNSQILAVIFLVVMVLGFRRRQAFISLLKSRLRFVEPEPVAREAMPAEVAALLDAARAELEAGGFAYVRTEAGPPFSLFDPRALMFRDIYWHDEHGTLAAVRLAEPYTGQAVSVTFLTAFADGVKLETLNRTLWSIVAPDLPGHVYEDPYADTLEAQWQAHLQALARESAAHGQPQEREATLAALHADKAAYAAWLSAIGWLAEDAPGIHRFTVKGAWRYASRQLRGFKQVRAALKRPYRHAYTPDLHVQRSHELAGFATTVEQGAQPLPRWMKVAMFVLTLAVSFALFGRALSLLVAAALLLVLLVHEGGHLLAMRAFGYRNLSMIFLPFFGAVASGHKTHVKPWQETVILLAGPLPGLLAALLLSQLSPHGMSSGGAEFWRMVFWFGLIINLFNLLPVGILDGGRLFQLALLSRFPYVKAFFWVAGAAIGAAYGIFNGLIVITLAMLLLLLGARNQFRAARAVSVIQARAKANGKGALGKEDAIAYLADYLAQPEFSEANAQGWAKRHLVATTAYPRLLQGVPALATSAGVLAAHGAAFFLPLFAAAWLMQQPQKPPLLRAVPYIETAAGKRELAQGKRRAAAAEDRFIAQYQATQDPQKKWDMLDDAEDSDASQFDPDPKWLKQQRAALLPLLPADHPARLWPVLMAAAKGGPKAERQILAVIERLDQGDGARIAALDPGRFGTLRAAWHMLTRQAAPQTLAAQDAVLEAAWRRMAARAADPAWRRREDGRRIQLASSGAHLAFAAGSAGRAEQWMARRACCVPAGDPGFAPEQGWFLLDLGRADDARALALQALLSPKVRGYWRDAWLSVAGWSYMAQNDPRAADGMFVLAAHVPQTASAPKTGWLQKMSHFNVGTWLLGIIEGQPEARQPPITNAMLDHLAALEAYDPQGAARYRATLAGRMDAEWRQNVAPYLVGRVDTDGWGRMRTEALEKLLAISPEAVARVE